MHQDLKAAYRFWIGKLGAQRLNEVLDGILPKKTSRPKTVSEKASRIVETYKSDPEALDKFVESGFDHSYHQRIYLRKAIENFTKTKQNAGSLAGQCSPDVEVKLKAVGSKLRMLLWVYEELDFRIKADGSDVIKALRVKVPTLLRLSDSVLELNVMTILSRDWQPLFGPSVVRSLGSLRSEASRDKILSLIGTPEEPLAGQPLDFSTKATKLMKADHVDTYAGTFSDLDGAAPRIVTSHKSVAEKKRVGLREAGKDKYNELVNAKFINACEVMFTEKKGNVAVGSRFSLYPKAGEIVVSRQLDAASVRACVGLLS